MNFDKKINFFASRELKLIVGTNPNDAILLLIKALWKNQNVVKKFDFVLFCPLILAEMLSVSSFKRRMACQTAAKKVCENEFDLET